MTQTRVAALIGSPVAHSLSPVIHRAGFAALGVDWTYVAFDVATGDAPAALGAMRTLGIGGMSVTTPHKEAIAAAVDRLDPAAQALDSVNTVSWSAGELVGSSTDGAGFVASLAAAGIEVAGATVAVLGAGGAARSVVDALGRSGVASIAIVNRTAERAARAARLSSVASVGDASSIAGADVVVNATSVGFGVDPASAGPDDLPCDPDLLDAAQVVADLVYHPLETAWSAAARRLGATVVDGLGMLVHQAALQQRAWLGAEPDTTVMRAAAESELARRAAER